MRKVRDEIRNEANVEKITTMPFDEIIGHSECERKYFTTENNNIIINRLRKEANVELIPYLGLCVDFGMGDIYLEEGKHIFKFYLIDRAYKYEYQEFSDIRDAIEHLINFYRQCCYVDENKAKKMKKIFFNTLHLEEQKNKKLIK